MCELWLSRTMPASAIAGVIAEEYGVVASKSAVIGIAFRAGLAEQGWKRPPGQSPAARARKNAKQSAARAAARAALPPKPPKPPAAPKPVAPPRPAIEAAPDRGLPVSLRIPLVGIRDGMCRFIADDPAGGGATCCGHATAQGSPWCPSHRALCVSGTAPRPSAWIPYSRMKRAA
ncbi:GcrA family cell cycle regulator [Methylobacterium aquaticum]|uniref:GcrA family cell cycle regulator n=1 Tax=Methylobacterium aquaticum TaxID=270351 RepID=UPI001933E93A|nr:GcrA family cell cycle regulator [Methylobacterium aquaticum]